MFDNLDFLHYSLQDMTDEEYDSLDERLSNTIPTLGPNGIGFFSRKGFMVIGLDENTARIGIAEKLNEAEREAAKPDAVWLNEDEFWNED